MKAIILTIVTFSLVLLSSLVVAKDVAPSSEQGNNQSTSFLFADSNNNHALDKHEPLVVVGAHHYRKLFKRKVPLERMLRSQVNDMEFIALNHNELTELDTNKDSTITVADKSDLHKIYFIHIGGTIEGDFIATNAKMVDMGKLKSIVFDTNSMEARQKQREHTVHFHNGDDLKIKSSTIFLPWIGL